MPSYDSAGVLYDDLDITYDSFARSYDGGVPDFALFHIYMAFGQAPLSTSLVWTEISDQVFKMTPHRLFQHELGQVQAGTATFSVWNLDGRWNSWNTASPYGAGNLRPMVPVKVTAEWNNVTYGVWYGYVDAFPQRWADHNKPAVEISATDGFKFLNLAFLTDVGYDEEVLADGPTGYWRVGDIPRSTTAKDSSGHAHNATYLGSPTLGAAGALAGDADTAVGVDRGFVLPPAATMISGTADFSVELWFKLPALPTGNGQMYSQTSNSITTLFGFPVDISYVSIGLAQFTGGGQVQGRPIFYAGDTDGGSSLDDASSATSLADDQWHHLVATRGNGGQRLTLYVDGVQVAQTTSFPAGNASIPTTNTTARFAGGQLGQGITNCTFDELALYGTELSAARVAVHYAHAVNVGAGDKSGARINRILDLVGWPASMRSIETGQSTIPPITGSLASTSALSEMQAVALAEDGIVYIGPDGNVVFHDRHHPLTAATSLVSQLTLGGNVVAGESPYRLDGTSTTEDDVDIWNEIPVSRVGGALQIASDGTVNPPTGSQGTFGKRSLPGLTNLQLSTDEECADRANWRLAHDKDPQPRVPNVSIDPRADPDKLFPALLGFDFQYRVTFNYSGLGGGTDLHHPALIEGISHTITPSTMRAVWNLFAADTQQYFTFDGPAGTGFGQGLLAY